MYVGMLLYIFAAISDMNARIKSIDTILLKRWHQREVLWLAYVQEINVHIEVIG